MLRGRTTLSSVVRIYSFLSSVNGHFFFSHFLSPCISFSFEHTRANSLLRLLFLLNFSRSGSVENVLIFRKGNNEGAMSKMLPDFLPGIVRFMTVCPASSLVRLSFSVSLLFLTFHPLTNFISSSYIFLLFVSSSVRRNDISGRPLFFRRTS